jgi:hypothetical protein
MIRALGVHRIAQLKLRAGSITAGTEPISHHRRARVINLEPLPADKLEGKRMERPSIQQCDQSSPTQK